VIRDGEKTVITPTLADRASVAVVQGHETVGDPLPREPAADLLDHPPAEPQQRGQALSSPLGRVALQRDQMRVQALRLTDRQAQQVPQLTGDLQDFLLGLTGPALE
jgi:hypothetical protein